MGLSLTFWIVAWTTMGIAFLMAALAIICGAWSLDRNADDGTDFLRRESHRSSGKLEQSEFKTHREKA